MSQLTDNVQANRDLFVTQSQETRFVWGLSNEEGDWLSVASTEFEDSEVMPFWSSKEDAEQQCADEWAEFRPSELPLDIFLEDWMLTLAEDGVLVGLNWNAELEGVELEPSDVVKLYV